MRFARFASVAIAFSFVAALALRVAPIATRADQRAAAQPRPSSAGRLAWPAPPAPARIRFVRAIDPRAVRGRPSVFTRLLRFVVGRGDEPEMKQPYGIAVGPDGTLYVADTFGRAIHVYDLEKSRYSAIDVAGDSLIGVGVAAGRLFVTDSASGRVLCLDPKGRVLWSRGPKEGLLRPTGLVVGDDRVYVTDTVANRVVVLNFAGAVVAFFGERGNGPGQFNYPTNIARGADGRLYVTDAMNFRVQVFDADGRHLRAFGRLGDAPGDFDKPKGIAVDSEGHVYVVEGINDVVQIFDESGRLLLHFGESGSGDGQFWLPSGIAIARDVVYVADAANQRVEIFEYVKEGR
jgi:DNA-binding beta-propeller fold protein YncE